MKKLFYALLLVSMIGCNKSLDSRWDIDVLIPFVNTTLSVEDIVADSLITINEDHMIELVLNSSALKISLDTIASIEESSTKDFFSIPFSSLDFAPGSSFPTPLDESELKIEDVELSNVLIKSGKLGLKITSYIEERLIADFEVSSAKIMGNTLHISEEFEQAIGNVPSIFYNEYDISGYDLDLTGINGDEFNKIVSTLDVIIDPNGSTVSVTNTDSLVVEVFYLDIKTAYAKGYFGAQQIDLSEEQSELSFLTNVQSGQIDLQNVSLDIDIINGVGADFRFRLDQLKGINTLSNSSVDLDHQLINNTINLDRATDNEGLQPTLKQFELNGTNSNIELWLENIPDKIEYSIEAEMNPLGNISGGNDFIYCESEFGIEFSAKIPLCFSSTELIFSDTLDVSISNEEDINEVRSGNLIMYVKNSFPLEGSMQIFLLQNNVLIDSIFSETSVGGSFQSFPANSYEQSILTVPITEEKFDLLRSSDHVIIETSLSTIENEIVKIYDDQKIDIDVVLDLNYLIDTQ